MTHIDLPANFAFLAGLHINPLFILSGLLVGALVGLTGVGGGSLMTPILVLLFGVHPATAVGTDLLYASITKGVGTAIHGARRTVDWRIVGLLAIGSIPATLLTLFGIEHCGKSAAMSSLITHVLGYALFAGLLPLRRHVLLVSGRTSFEIMQKALAGGVPIVAAASAPSSLAVEFARVNGQTLIGFLRANRMNVYAHAHRITSGITSDVRSDAAPAKV